MIEHCETRKERERERFIISGCLCYGAVCAFINLLRIYFDGGFTSTIENKECSYVVLYVTESCS